MIDGLLNEVTHFENWVLEHNDKPIELTSQEDLKLYAEQLENREVKIYMRALALFFNWRGNKELSKLAHSLREAETAKTRKAFSLREFQGVNLDVVAKLEAMGIKNMEDMLSVGETPSSRQELAIRSGIATETILDLVKLSDLSRLPGVKGIRARLYLDAGLDSVETFSQWEPDALQKFLEKFIQDTGFDGIAPLPKEIENTIKQASSLEKLIEC